MSKLTDVKGVIFDYGGTIDTNSRHWAEVLWSKYEEFQVPVDKASFREAYVHGERTLARVPLVKPEHNFHDVLRIKTDIQVKYLVEQGKLDGEEACRENYAEKVADSCYRYVLDVLERTRPVVKALSERPSALCVMTAISTPGVVHRPTFITSAPHASRVPSTRSATISPEIRASRPTTMVSFLPGLRRAARRA